MLFIELGGAVLILNSLESTYRVEFKGFYRKGWRRKGGGGEERGGKGKEEGNEREREKKKNSKDSEF